MEKKIVFNTSSLPTISMAMIVKNESENLKRLLPIVRGMIDELVVVDTGSEDDSKEVAKSLGAEVFDFPWCEDFSAARNAAISHCTKDYIIWLDADDYMERQDIAKLKWFLKTNPDRAVFLNLLDRRFDRDFQSLQLRVFPNHKDIEFRGRVHEQVSFSIEEKGVQYANCDIMIIHLGYNSPEEITKKLERNLSILLTEYESNKDDYLINVNAAKSYIGLGLHNEAEKFADNALNLIRNKKALVNKENQFISVLTKINLLTIANKTNDIIPLLLEFKDDFADLPMYKFTCGEAYFKSRNYKEAYKNLLILKSGKFSLGMIPVDARTIIRNLTFILIVSSLAIGDFITAGFCIGKMIGDIDFKVKGV